MIGLILSALIVIPGDRIPLFEYMRGDSPAAMVTYAPSQLDPRQVANHAKLPTSSIHADLTALRPYFDGLILYGTHPDSTPRVLEAARELKFRAVILGIWEPKSQAELDLVSELVERHKGDFALGVLVGNEGITFQRYGIQDLTTAADQLRPKLPKTVPISTSEPLVGYDNAAVLRFGDFLAPNIHPVFDRVDLGPEAAAEWVRGTAQALARRADKPVVVKETGFPHGGKPAYTESTQHAFWTAYRKPTPPDSGRAWVSHAVAFDAFDLPWKSDESKLAIEQFWGLFSNSRQPHPAVTAWPMRKAR